MVILSGGPNSVHVEGAPTVPEGFFDHCAARSIPVLGICYGMQLIVQRLGGEVESAEKAEYGRMPVHTVNDSVLYGEEMDATQQVWMSHGDEAKKLPDGFRCVGTSDAGAVVAIEHPERKIFGLQYHPEVTHSERGFETIRHFLFHVAGLTAGWSMQNVLDEQIAIVKEKVGPTAHVICALSGGVDSAVAGGGRAGGPPFTPRPLHHHHHHQHAARAFFTRRLFHPTPPPNVWPCRARACTCVFFSKAFKKKVEGLKSNEWVETTFRGGGDFGAQGHRGPPALLLRG